MSARFSRNEVDRLRREIHALLSSGRLNAWQTKFLEGVDDRLAKFGPRTPFSEKQWAKLEQVLGRSFKTSASNMTPFRKPTRRNPRRPILPRRLVAGLFVLILTAIGLMNSDDGSPLDGPASRLVTNASAEPVTLDRSSFTVTDGDTIRLNGSRAGTRLVGYNTPETFRPRCDRGVALGNAATDRLRNLVQNASTIVLEPVQCACAPGTRGTDQCNYGRDCALLRIDGSDVADILVSEGLAARFECGRASCPPTPRPWCYGD